MAALRLWLFWKGRRGETPPLSVSASAPTPSEARSSVRTKYRNVSAADPPDAYLDSPVGENPGDAVGFLDWDNANSKPERFDEAMAAYDQAIRLKPDLNTPASLLCPRPAFPY